MGVSKGERWFYRINNSFMVLVIIVMLYPFWYMIMGSLSDSTEAVKGVFFLKPAGFSLAAY